MATVRWIGNAQAVKQVTTIAVSGTWATSDTATLTINDKNVTVTVGTDVSTSNIADILARAVNGDDDTPNLLNDESRNVNGQEVPEFTEVVASNSGATLTLTSAVAGVPFTVTASESTAGTGALGTPTEATAATGPNHADNADNWEGGSLPGSGAVLAFDSGSVPVKYGLTYFRDNTVDVTFLRTTDYAGNIGLPDYNSLGYAEYRPKRLQLYEGASAGDNYFLKGTATASTTAFTRLDCATESYDSLYVRSGALTNSSSFYSLEIYGGTFDVMDIRSGNVRVGDVAATASEVAVSSSLSLGNAGGTSTDLTITLEDADLSDCEDILQLSGRSIFRLGATVGYTGGGTATWTVGGGQAEMFGSARNLVLEGGIVYFMRSVPAQCRVYGGELSLARLDTDASGKTLYIFEGATFRDPGDRASDAVIYLMCAPADATLDLPRNKKYTLAAGATTS